MLSRRRSGKKNRRNKRQTKRGGSKVNVSGNASGKYFFSVILFSNDPVPEKISKGVLKILKGLFGDVTMAIPEEPVACYSFIGATGINSSMLEKHSEVVYTIVKAPPVLYKNTSKNIDARLTILEGRIGAGLLDAGIDVSLINGPHGIAPLSDTEYNVYSIGLCYPACSDHSRELFNSYMSS